MQSVELDLSHHNFFCPITGQAILSDEHFEPSEATLFAFLDDVGDFVFIRSDLETKCQQLEKDDDTTIDQFLCELLESVDSANLVCYSITTRGIACGPVSSTIRIAVDMDHSV